MSRKHSASRPLISDLRRLLAALFCVALLLGCAFAEDSAAVPQLVKFSGTISGTPAGTVSVIFALYKDQTGGAPLWQEVQNLAVDASGHYTSLLGARSAAGIPVEVFSTGEARWLGVQAERQPEQPRVLLVSVPYALKASDAETLGGLPASAFLRASAAPVAVAAPANYINTAAVNAAARSAVAAAIAVNNPTLGYVPYFYDAGGDLQNSSIFQATTGNVGIGTTNPAAMFTLVGTNPSIRLENYSNISGDSPNFNFYTGRGTATTPLATQGGDNLGQFASAGYNGAAFPGSKVKVTFLSTENWTASANGTAMTFATTLNGTTSRAERMRIDNTGNVGIGTTAPVVPLEVYSANNADKGVVAAVSTVTSGTPIGFDAEMSGPSATGLQLNFHGPLTSSGYMIDAENYGVSSFTVDGGGNVSTSGNLSTSGVIQSTSGGFKFPDGSTQSKAGVTLTSPDSSITVVGTAAAPTVAVNTAVIQKRVSSTCSSGSAIASISSTGTVGCQTVSGGGAISLPVNWTSTVSNPPAGVLNVTNTTNGPTMNTQSNPTESFFTSIPSAIVGTATGTGVPAGVTGTATNGVGVVGYSEGSDGLGVVGYTFTSNQPPIIAYSGVTGYATGNDTKPRALEADLANGGGNVVEIKSSAATASYQLTGVNVEIDATTGPTQAFAANLSSPSATGLGLYFNVPPTSGAMISASANNGGSFRVDGSGNISNSGNVNASGSLTFNGSLQANSGLQVNAPNAVFNTPTTFNMGLNANGGITVGGPGAMFNSGLTSTGASIFNGNVDVKGTLSKTSGSFKIDHPLDPANKYLYHSFVESPDMMNIYNGVVRLNRRGEAIVELPDYFQALNQDFRYQLTSIGRFMPVYIARKIRGNRFRIAGGKPGAEVSWQVTGIRHDAYADAHRIQVEETKTGNERGTYLHPELFEHSPVVARK